MYYCDNCMVVKVSCNNVCQQAQFSQMRPMAMPPAVGPRMQMYPPGGPGMGQQMFYGQGPPTMITQPVLSFFLALHI